MDFRRDEKYFERFLFGCQMFEEKKKADKERKEGRVN
jgi:hypothetical protein